MARRTLTNQIGKRSETPSMHPSHEDRFAAVLAHQIKTPLAAIEAAAVNVRRNIRCLLEEIGPTSTEKGSADVASFIAHVVTEPAPAPVTGLMPTDRVEVMARRLSRAGIEGDLGEISAALIRGGWDTYIDEIVPLLLEGGNDRLDILETTARLRVNLGVLDSSIRRLSGISSAVAAMTGPIARGRVRIAPGIEAVACQIRGILPGGVRLEVRIDSMPDVSARGEILDEVWSNLMTNAAQAVGEAGRIEVEGFAHAESGRATVRVIDDGPGIPPGARSRIFEPFFTTRPGEGGIGLGLSLCRRIVEALEGSITVESQPRRTVFEVSLPPAGGGA